MKVNIVTAAICTLLAIIIALGLWQIPGGETQKWCVALGGGALSLATLVFGIGISYNVANIGTNIRVLSMSTLFLLIVFNVVIGFFMFTPMLYIILSGLILAVYLLILNGLIKVAKDNPGL